MACKIIISWEDIATRENLEHPSSAGQGLCEWKDVCRLIVQSSMISGLSQGGNCWIQKKKCQVVEHCFQKSEEILAFKRRKGVDGCCHIFAFDIMVQLGLAVYTRIDRIFTESASLQSCLELHGAVCPYLDPSIM